MASPNPADPWSWDAFSPDVPKVDAPEPFKAAPRTFPEEDRLFKVQKDALRATQTARVLADSLRGNKDLGHQAERDLRQLVTDTENTYRAIRSYLDKYVNPSASL